MRAVKCTFFLDSLVEIVYVDGLVGAYGLLLLRLGLGSDHRRCCGHLAGLACCAMKILGKFWEKRKFFFFPSCLDNKEKSGEGRKERLVARLSNQALACTEK